MVQVHVRKKLFCVNNELHRYGNENLTVGETGTQGHNPSVHVFVPEGQVKWTPDMQDRFSSPKLAPVRFTQNAAPSDVEHAEQFLQELKIYRDDSCPTERRWTPFTSFPLV